MSRIAFTDRLRQRDRAAGKIRAVRRALTLALIALAACAPAAGAVPIPEGSRTAGLPVFEGRPATPDPIAAPLPPRHPHMAPNERSNLHVDAYQTDENPLTGPLGRDMQVLSTFYSADCASVTFDSRGRIVTVCVGVTGPTLKLLDAATLAELATFALPPRQPAAPAGSPFQDFAGGGYFYLDDGDRAIVPTTTRHLLVVRAGESGFVPERDVDLTGAVPSGDKVISALPDWSGRIWFASTRGVVGTVDPASGQIRSLDLGEENGNSFAVDDQGGVYVVTNTALYRFAAAPDGTPRVVWLTPYENVGIQKPGQAQAGSGTTPTVMDGGLVAITDNGDPMNVVVLRRDSGRLVCRQPVFQKGASATDNSLIAAGRSLIVENNYGYTGPDATEGAATTSPGIERVDVDPDGLGCRRIWTSRETAPTVVPKLSLGAGLVYTYTNPPDQPGGGDGWYLTAIDFRSGRTVFRRLAGEGLGFNNNYAPVTIGPDGSAYVGSLGGLVGMRDAIPPPQGLGASGGAMDGRIGLSARLRLRVKRVRGSRVRLALAGPDRGLVARVRFNVVGSRRYLVDARPPFKRTLHVDRRRGQVVRALVELVDGTGTKVVRTLRARSR
jgi:hypothetical protein